MKFSQFFLHLRQSKLAIETGALVVGHDNDIFECKTTAVEHTPRTIGTSGIAPDHNGSFFNSGACRAPYIEVEAVLVIDSIRRAHWRRPCRACLSECISDQGSVPAAAGLWRLLAILTAGGSCSKRYPFPDSNGLIAIKIGTTGGVESWNAFYVTIFSIDGGVVEVSGRGGSTGYQRCQEVAAALYYVTFRRQIEF